MTKLPTKRALSATIFVPDLSPACWNLDLIPAKQPAPSAFAPSDFVYFVNEDICMILYKNRSAVVPQSIASCNDVQTAVSHRWTDSVSYVSVEI